MDNIKNNIRKNHFPSTRRLVQLYAGLLYNAHLKGFIEGEIYTGKTKVACVPGFNCYSCPGAVGACPLGAIQNALASSGHRAGWYILGIIVLYGVILGRTICGWLCPLGLIQELLHKIPSPKLRKSPLTRALSWLKYLVLAVFVVWIPLWYGLKHDLPVPAFCKYICPAGTFEGAMGLLSSPANSGKFSMLGILFTRKFSIMVVIGVACIFCYRSFCRFLCPLGAIFGLFNRLNVIGIKVDNGRCNHCGACVRSCGMDVRRVGDHECINCAKCMDVCNQNAISFKAGKITLKAPEAGCAGDAPDAPMKRKRLSRILWAVALVILGFALLWFNFLDPSVRKTSAGRAATTEETADAETGAAAAQGTADVKTGAATAQEMTDTETDDAATEEAADVETDVAVTEKTVGAETDDAVTEGMADAETDDAAAEGTASAETEASAGTEANAAGTSDTAESAGDKDNMGSSESVKYESTAPIGHEVGMQLEDFTIQCMDGSEFHLAENRGKVTIINLWATYCAPCVQELPHFSKLYQEHEGDIAMLAVHSSLTTVDPVEYVADKDWAMPIAVDTDDDLIFNIVGGSSTMPQTIVLNRRGEVIYNEVRSITPEMLDSLYKSASETPQ